MTVLPSGAPASLGACIAGRYRVVGDGGDAIDEQLQRRVELHIARTDSRSRARFLRAALAASNLSHPNIVRVHDFGVDVDAGVAFLVSERVAGSTLQADVDMDGPMPWPRAVHVLRQLAAALSATHHARCVGDVRATHVRLCRAEGLSDFVKMPLAPARRANAPRDVRAMGRVAWRLLTGAPPLDASDAAPRQLSSLVDVPRALDDVIAASMDARPARRPTAVAMYSSLRALLPGR